MRLRLWGGCVGRALVALGVVAAFGAAAQTPLAEQPDPTSFVKRADTNLILLGAPQRFAGDDISWLGLRRNAGGGWQRTTPYEVRDAFLTAAALGGTVVRAPGLAGTAGCPLCLEPVPGKFAEESFAALDQALKSANDLGIRLILPLTGGTADCGATEAGPLSLCAYVHWHGGTDKAAFFTDPGIRAAFVQHVNAVLSHVNALTGVAYKDDPAILAWENCTGCGAGADPGAVGAWTEAIGQAIRAVDHFHLYENGAFAGLIRPGVPGAVPAAVFAPPTVDVVGDTAPPPGGEGVIRKALAAAAGAVNAAGRAYAIDDLSWGPHVWPTQDALQLMLDEVVRNQAVTLALIPGLQGHAEMGGYIQPPQSGGAPALYFPAQDTHDMTKGEMEARALALRHFSFQMADVTGLVALPLPARPDIIAARHGVVTWRGGAGAAFYSIERSADPSQPFSWNTVCDQCAGAAQWRWQDPSPPSGTAYYRVLPFNMNGHKSLPSAPARNE